MRSDAVRIEEGLFIIGSDVVTSKEQIKLGIAKFFKTFEDKYNTQILHWAYHDHEGKDKNQINRHVHFLFDNVNTQGNMVKRNMKRQDFSELQTMAFESFQKFESQSLFKKTLNPLVRAINYQEKGEYAPRQKSHRHYRKDKAEQAENQMGIEIRNNFMEEIEELESETTLLEKENQRLADKLNQFEEKYNGLEYLYKKKREDLKRSGEANQIDYQNLKKQHEKDIKRLKNTIKDLKSEIKKSYKPPIPNWMDFKKHNACLNFSVDKHGKEFFFLTGNMNGQNTAEENRAFLISAKKAGFQINNGAVLVNSEGFSKDKLKNSFPELSEIHIDKSKVKKSYNDLLKMSQNSKVLQSEENPKPQFRSPRM
jgi:hypothetical protein